jgi:hypothetical protein
MLPFGLRFRRVAVLAPPGARVLSERTEDLRLGMEIDDAIELWSRHGERITGSPVSERAAEENHIFEWAHGEGRGRAELRAEQGSTLLRMTLEDGDPDSSFDKILERLSDALDEVGGVDRPSYRLDLDPGSPPDATTSADQPL